MLTPVEIEERLVEAMLVCWRTPDRERGWQRVRSTWPEMLRHTWFGDYGETPDGTERRELRPASQTRREIAEMEEAFSWVGVLGGGERRIVGLAVTMLAKGHREVPWKRLLRPMGLTRGVSGLRMRYDRALSKMCLAQSPGNVVVVRVNQEKVHGDEF